MGFVMLGVFAFNELALQGVIMQMLAHGISTGALFIIVGAIQKRIHTRNLDDMGGFWEIVPRMGGITLLFTMASLGLPGLGNFIAEFLILAGSFQASVFWTVVSSIGLVAATIYSLRIMQKVFYGRREKDWKFKDFDPRELFVLGSLILVIVWFGIYPQAVINKSKAPVQTILNNMKTGTIEVTNK
jgi:NADH-quinone oxidoreductase subunit M